MHFMQHFDGISLLPYSSLHRFVAACTIQRLAEIPSKIGHPPPT